MFSSLAQTVEKACPKERLLLIGFAETATAIGSALAVHLDAPYLQTTRETIPGADYVYFSESHSHATEQRLVRSDLEQILKETDRILFVEDEVTTGNTILNIIRILKKEYSDSLRFAVASILNGMNRELEAAYQALEIPLYYLVKTCHDSYTAIAEGWTKEGITNPPDTAPASVPFFEEKTISGAVNARCLTRGGIYQNACQLFWKQLQNLLPLTEKQKILVLGTEEFMYPALFTASQLEKAGHTVLCHSTTRSPIMPGSEPEYPLHEAYELISLYEKERITYLYDLDSYDLVLILTDSPAIPEEGRNSLLNALSSRGNTHILLIRWCPD